MVLHVVPCSVVRCLHVTHYISYLEVDGHQKKNILVLLERVKDKDHVYNNY